MELTVVGSGTVAPDPEHRCASHLVRSGDLNLLMDCGFGAVHTMAGEGLPWPELTHVLLTHFHPDHIGDLPYLFFALKWGLPEPRRSPLEIVGPEGTARLLTDLGAAFGEFVRDPGFPIEVREVRPRAEIQLPGGVQVVTHKTPHTEESIAYLIGAGELMLGYTGDTGPSHELADFFRGANVLVAECSLPDEVALETHLTPSWLAELARAADPEHLVVTHVYPQLDRAGIADRLRRVGVRSNVHVPRDGWTLRVSCGDAA